MRAEVKSTDTKKVVVGDNTFYITPFPAFTAVNVFGYLTKDLLPAVGGIAGLLQKIQNGFDSDINDVVPMLQEIVANIDGDVMESTARRLLTQYKNVVFDDEDGRAKTLCEDDVNEIFCQDIIGIAKLAYEVINVNYADFFGGLRVLLGGAK